MKNRNRTLMISVTLVVTLALVISAAVAVYFSPLGQFLPFHGASAHHTGTSTNTPPCPHQPASDITFPDGWSWSPATRQATIAVPLTASTTGEFITICGYTWQGVGPLLEAVDLSSATEAIGVDAIQTEITAMRQQGWNPLYQPFAEGSPDSYTVTVTLKKSTGRLAIISYTASILSDREAAQFITAASN